jgi:hypothetical protein
MDMGGSRASSPGRAVASGVVVAAHAGVLLILSIALERRTRPSLPAGSVSTLILLAVPSLAPAPRDRRRRGAIEESAPIEPLALPPIPPPDIELPGGAHAPIDWLAEAGRAAQAATTAPHTRSFGEIPQAPSWLGSPRSAPEHRAGEQYRLETGEWIVWVTDRCYIVSEPQPLAMPDVFARSLGTPITCQAPPGPPPGELFKGLPAYKKYHPQQRRGQMSPCSENEKQCPSPMMK